MYLFRKKGTIGGVYCSRGYKFKRPRVPGLKPRSYFLTEEACNVLKAKFEKRGSRVRRRAEVLDRNSSPKSSSPEPQAAPLQVPAPAAPISGPTQALGYSQTPSFSA